jgi:hypothetical protein
VTNLELITNSVLLKSLRQESVNLILIFVNYFDIIIFEIEYKTLKSDGKCLGGENRSSKKPGIFRLAVTSERLTLPSQTDIAF